MPLSVTVTAKQLYYYIVATAGAINDFEWPSSFIVLLCCCFSL